MPYQEVAVRLNMNVSEASIQRAVQKESFFHRFARKKPPISEEECMARLQWA